jgi:hypothetical protein
VLAANFVFVHSTALAAELAAALQILEEFNADEWEYLVVHGTAAAMAAVLGDVELARQEAAVALGIGRRVGNQWLLGLNLYAFGLASWQADPTAARLALKEHIQIARATGYDWVLARVLALFAQLEVGGGDRPATLAALHEGLERAHIDGDRPAAGVCLARGAVVMAACGELDTAAVFWGAVADGVFARLTVLPANEIPDHKEFIATVRSELGDDNYTAATARGAAMTYEEITAYAIAAVNDAPSTSAPRRDSHPLDQHPQP